VSNPVVKIADVKPWKPRLVKILVRVAVTSCVSFVGLLFLKESFPGYFLGDLAWIAVHIFVISAILAGILERVFGLATDDKLPEHPSKGFFNEGIFFKDRSWRPYNLPPEVSGYAFSSVLNSHRHI
jgi:hypothetical protein